MVSDRPQPARVVETAEHLVAVFLEQLVDVDVRLPGLEVDLVHVDIGIVVGERMRPQEFPGLTFDHEHAAALADRHNDLTLLIARQVGAPPLHVPGVGIDQRAQQDALLVVIGVPVVARQLLVVPDELSGRDVERDRRVAVEIGRSRV